MTEVQNDPDRVLHPLKRTAAGRVRAGVVGRGAGRHRRAPARASATARPASRSAGTWATRARSATRTRCGSKGFLDALGSPHYYTAGSQDVNNRFAASATALRLAAGRPDPRPPAHGLPADGRRQPARVARLGAHRAARARPAPRDRRARRADRRRRSAPHGDRARVRARRGTPGRRRVAAALAAPGDLRGGPRRPALLAGGPRDAARAGARAPPASRPRRPRPRTGVPAEAVRALARDFAAADGPSPTAAPARASAATARSSRS